jgi:hypothetical protein
VPASPVEQLDLHRGPEAFHHCVVEPVADGPKEGIRPAERILSLKAYGVKWIP